MEIQGLSPRVSFLLSLSWLISRLCVIIITPFFLRYDCDNDLKRFLEIIFYSTICTVALQISYYAYRLSLKRKSAQPEKWVQVSYFITDYIFYGLFRFVIFVLGVIWIGESQHCDDMIKYYAIALCAAYFSVCWTVCWVGCVSMFVLCWDAQTL
jgi:hypothetical protein